MAARITASGMAALLIEMPQAGIEQLMQRITREAAQQAVLEWMRGAGGVPAGGLKQRFSPRAWDALGLTHRTARYEARKARVFGRNLPYRSPRRGGAHMASLVMIPGAGTSISPRRTSGAVGVRVAFPGARILNRIRAPYGARYRAEFLQLTTRARAQGAWMQQRMRSIIIDKMQQVINNQPRVTIHAGYGADAAAEVA